MVQRRSVFNSAPIESSPEPIGTNLGEVLEEALSKKEENTVVNITSTGKIKEESEIQDYSVQIKVSKGREIRLVTYNVSAVSKEKAKDAALERLVENGYEKEKLSSIKVLKGNPNSKDQDTLFDTMEIDYEVSFNIKIGQDRFRKTFIVKAKDETQARNNMLIRCKKEYKNYRTVNKVEIKEADEFSKESSEILEEKKEEIKQEEQKPIEEVKEEIKENKEEKKTENNASDFINRIAREYIDKKMEEIPKELSEKKLFEVTVTIKDKEVREKMSDCFQEPMIIKADSASEAEKRVNDLMNSAGMNRKVKRSLKHSYKPTEFGAFLRKEFLDQVSESTRKSVKEYLKENTEVPDDEFNPDDYTERFESSFDTMFERIKKNILEAIDERDYSECEITGTMVTAEDVKKFMKPIQEENKFIIKKQGNILLASAPKRINCRIVSKDKSETFVDIEADDEKEALKAVSFAIQQDGIGKLNSLANVDYFSFMNDGKHTTVEVGNVRVEE